METVVKSPFSSPKGAHNFQDQEKKLLLSKLDHRPGLGAEGRKGKEGREIIPVKDKNKRTDCGRKAAADCGTERCLQGREIW